MASKTLRDMLSEYIELPGEERKGFIFTLSPHEQLLLVTGVKQVSAEIDEIFQEYLGL